MNCLWYVPNINTITVDMMIFRNIQIRFDCHPSSPPNAILKQNLKKKSPRNVTCQKYALIQTFFNYKRNFSYIFMSSLKCYHKCWKKDIIAIFTFRITIIIINIKVVYITCSSLNFNVTQSDKLRWLSRLFNLWQLWKRLSTSSLLFHKSFWIFQNKILTSN